MRGRDDFTVGTLGRNLRRFSNCAPLARPQELCHWLRGVFERARAEGVPSTVTPGEGEGLRAVAYELWQAGLRTRHALARAPPEALERGRRIEPRRGASGSAAKNNRRSQQRQ